MHFRFCRRLMKEPFCSQRSTYR
uniref:Uncharacterized protein n=1 Tax=Anguilla anguilla TaxID=7936 RepID=A0A0E9R8U7_ANGAN